MKASLFFVLIALPILATCFNTKYGPYTVNSRAMIYRPVYMYNDKDSPNPKAGGHARLSITLSASLSNGRTPSGTVITAFLTENAFNHMGYKNSSGVTIPCCDEEAVNGLCNQMNTLLIPNEYTKESSVKTKEFTASSTIEDYYDVQATGMYYVVAAICNPAITPNTVLEGYVIAENAYGHLPATQYYSLPFYRWMTLVYVITLIIWVSQCVKFQKEIMSVHIIILVVLGFFVADYLFKVISLSVYNSSGFDTLIYVSLFLDVFTRTLTRVLTILVCMGLGISRASISDTTLKLIVFAVAYFVVNFWDSYMTLQPATSETVDKVRVYISAGMDALVYFWVFQSLMDTMDELKANNQNTKLSVFVKLYTLLLLSVIVSTATLILFSYLVNSSTIPNIWRYQWFMNDGVWSVYYFILFACLMFMWKPNENASAYAYHSEIATNEQDDEYGLPQDKLVDSGDEGNIVVNTISDDMKPMGIAEGSGKA